MKNEGKRKEHFSRNRKKKHFGKNEENNTLNKGINILAKTKKRTFSTNQACKITQRRD